MITLRRLTIYTVHLEQFVQNEPCFTFCILLTARVCTSYFKGKGKTIPMQAWTDL